MLLMKIKKPDICDAATLHWHCQRAAKQPKMQLQNSCGAMQAWPVLHTQPGPELANYLQNLQQHFKKKPFKKQEYFAYSPKILEAITAVGFGPFLSAYFNSFCKKTSWLILQIKCWSFSPKSEDEDEWKPQVAELSPARRWLQPLAGPGREPGLQCCPTSCEPAEQLLINTHPEAKLVIRRNANIYLNNFFYAFNLVCS